MKFTSIIGQMMVIDSVLKINVWMCKMKDLNGETMIGSFYKKELWLSKLKMTYCREPANIKN